MMYGRMNPPTFLVSCHRRHPAHRCACASSSREVAAVDARRPGRGYLMGKRWSTPDYSGAVRDCARYGWSSIFSFGLSAFRASCPTGIRTARWFYPFLRTGYVIHKTLSKRFELSNVLFRKYPAPLAYT